MHYKVLKNIIPKSIIDDLLTFFNKNIDNLEVHARMEKINRPWQYKEVRQLSEIISQHIDIAENIGDNIYRHRYPYFPHVDIDNNYPSVNFLIPLYVHDAVPQSFVIFDQYVKEPLPTTWIGDIELSEQFKKNSSKKYMHLDSNVENLTETDIDDDFYEKYLNHPGRTKQLFYGCTGNAVMFSPGDAIVWDSKYIHCTGKMETEYKIGLSLRFKGAL